MVDKKGNDDPNKIDECIQAFVNAIQVTVRTICLSPVFVVLLFVDIPTLWSGLFASKCYCYIITGEIPDLEQLGPEGIYEKYRVWDGTFFFNFINLIITFFVMLVALVTIPFTVLFDVFTLNKVRVSLKWANVLTGIVFGSQNCFDKMSHSDRTYWTENAALCCTSGETIDHLRTTVRVRAGELTIEEATIYEQELAQRRQMLITQTKAPIDVLGIAVCMILTGLTCASFFLPYLVVDVAGETFQFVMFDAFQQVLDAVGSIDFSESNLAVVPILTIAAVAIGGLAVVCALCRATQWVKVFTVIATLLNFTSLGLATSALAQLAQATGAQVSPALISTGFYLQGASAIIGIFAPCCCIRTMTGANDIVAVNSPA